MMFFSALSQTWKKKNAPEKLDLEGNPTLATEDMRMPVVRSRKPSPEGIRRAVLVAKALVARLASLMSNKPRKKLRRATRSAAILLVISTSALATYKYDTLACSLIEYSEFVEIEKNIYVSPDSNAEDRKELLSLIAQAKARVVRTYGQYSATPIIISEHDMRSLGMFASNETASTRFLPGRSYIVLGPKGHSVDIIAHELVHSEIFDSLEYYWTRTYMSKV